VTASASGADNGGSGLGAASFQYVSTMQLRDYRLSAAPEEPAKVAVRNDTGTAKRYPANDFHLVADHEMPLDLSQGPTNVTIGLQNGGRGWMADGRASYASSVPTTVYIDHATHEVVWMVQRSGDPKWAWTETIGDRLQLTLPGAGLYDVAAYVRPKKCGEPWLGESRSSVTTFWAKSVHVPMEAGAQRTVPVTKYEVLPQASTVQLTWAQQPTVATSVDKGHPVLVDPSGRSQPLMTGSHSAYVSPYPYGTWRVDWSTDSVTVGDDLDVSVRVSYDPWERSY
jgi:hypothetical protein